MIRNMNLKNTALISNLHKNSVVFPQESSRSLEEFLVGIRKNVKSEYKHNKYLINEIKINIHRF